MSTYALPTASSTGRADLRRADRAVILLLVVLLAAAAGLVVHAGQQAARRHAERLEHARLVDVRVGALAADRRVEQAFLRSAADAARTQAVAAVGVERAALVAARELAMADAAAVLARSAGKVDEARRTELAAAIDAGSGSGTVFSQIEAATTTVSTLAAAVAAAEASWTAEQQRLAAVDGARSVGAAAGAQSQSGSVRDVGEAALRALPGNAGIEIHWDDPDLGGHLGAVWSGNTRYIMVNSRRLAGNPDKTRDVVRHEIAHIYEGRLAAAGGLSWGQLDARMGAAFGPAATEKAADCVALRFGAGWTHYTSDCSSADKQAWVDALIGGYLP